MEKPRFKISEIRFGKTRCRSCGLISSNYNFLDKNKGWFCPNCIERLYNIYNFDSKNFEQSLIKQQKNINKLKKSLKHKKHEICKQQVLFFFLVKEKKKIKESLEQKKHEISKQQELYLFLMNKKGELEQNLTFKNRQIKKKDKQLEQKNNEISKQQEVYKNSKIITLIVFIATISLLLSIMAYFNFYLKSDKDVDIDIENLVKYNFYKKIEEKNIKHIINNWRNAWSTMNSKKFFLFYSKNFLTKGHASFKQWKNERVKKVNSEVIDLDLSNIQIYFNSYSSATATFHLFYKTKDIQEKVQKKLFFKKSLYGWLITKEEILPFHYPVIEVATIKRSTINSQLEIRYELSKKDLYYQVQYGNTLSDISKIFNIKMEALKEWNEIKNGEIKEGQEILLKNTYFIKHEHKNINKTFEKISEISNRYDVPIDDIIFFNGLRNNTVEPGKKIVLFIRPFLSYIVGTRDTLIEISNKFNINISTIKSINSLDSDYIAVGQKLIIPKKKKI